MKFKNRPLSANILFTIIIILLLVGTLLINGMALILSNKYPLYIDLTANASYEIGDETKVFLEDLDKPVKINVLSTEDGFSGSNYLRQAKRILTQYPRYSSNVTLEFIDFATDPTFSLSYPDLSLTHGDILVESEGRIKQVLVANLFNYTYTADQNLTIESSRAEEAITSAIINVTSGKTTKIAMLTGNGSTESKPLTALLTDNNYEIFSESMLTTSLEGYDAAILLSPTIDLSEDILRKLEDFLYNNGEYGKTLIYTGSVTQGDLPNLNAFLAEWGVLFHDGAVFETKSDRTYQYQPFYPIALYESGKYTSMLKDDTTPLLMPLARLMEVLFESKDGYYVQPLLYFSETAGVRPADAGENFDPSTAQIKGPLPAMVISSYNPGASKDPSHIVISSSTAMFEPASLQNTSLNNGEYTLNLLGDLCGAPENINIQPKSLSGKTLGITSSQMTGLGVILVGVIPFTIVASGIAVWFYRRYR